MGRSFKGGVRLNRRTMTDLVTDWFRDNQDSSISVKRLYDELKLKLIPCAVCVWTLFWTWWRTVS